MQQEFRKILADSQRPLRAALRKLTVSKSVDQPDDADAQTLLKRSLRRPVSIDELIGNREATTAVEQPIDLEKASVRDLIKRAYQRPFALPAGWPWR